MGAHLHPVKEETFDTRAMTNTDPKGFRRPVDTYLETEAGLYMARGADHPQFGYLESWLLPALCLRANIFHFRPGCERDQDFYIDIADVDKQGNGVWRTRDLYLDLVTRAGHPTTVLDADELAAATAAGLLTPEDAERAIESALAAVAGIARCGEDPMAWLRSVGVELTWAKSVELSPVAP